MNRERQIQAVESYVQAVRTGEGSAARQAARFLADNVVLVAGEEEVVGRADGGHGRGTIATDDATKARAFEIAPEVEQDHDPKRLGTALIIDVERLDGMSARGVIQLRRSS